MSMHIVYCSLAGPPKMGKQQGDSNSDTATDQSIGQAHAGGNAQTQLDGGYVCAVLLSWWGFDLVRV